MYVRISVNFVYIGDMLYSGCIARIDYVNFYSFTRAGFFITSNEMRSKNENANPHPLIISNTDGNLSNIHSMMSDMIVLTYCRT
jgi:hypothetical protein